MEEIEGRFEELFDKTNEVWKHCIDKVGNGENFLKNNKITLYIAGIILELGAIRRTMSEDIKCDLVWRNNGK